MHARDDVIGMQGFAFEDLEIGMSAEYRRVITDRDIEMFAEVSGDHNPLHLDDEFAENTIFKGRIVHGMYTAAMISTVIGTKLPGSGCIYVSQSLRFKAPVRPNDEVVARAIIEELIPGKRRVRLSTPCLVGDKVVVEGEALIQLPRQRP